MHSVYYTSEVFQLYVGILFVLSLIIKISLFMAAVYMTEEGYKKLLEQIEHMETVERPLISHQIAEARDKGDLSENAEYDAAKEAQGMLEMKISQLKDNLQNVRIINEKQLNTDFVQILPTVSVRNNKARQALGYKLVSEAEARLRERKISIYTHVEKGLLGKKIGDKTQISIPSGVVEFEIVDITF